MTLKKAKIIAIFGIFSICFFAHFFYSWFPNVLFSIFFPVNESIWEHMKIIFTSILIYSIVDYVLLKMFNICFNNFITNIFLAGIFSIISFLIIYLPFNYLFGENIFLNIFVLFISIELYKFFIYFRS